MDRIFTAEQFFDRALDVGIEVDRVENLHVSSVCEPNKRLTDASEAGTEVLASVPGHQHETLGTVEKGKLIIEARDESVVREHSVASPEQRVDHRVAGDDNLLRIGVLP